MTKSSVLVAAAATAAVTGLGIHPPHVHDSPVSPVSSVHPPQHAQAPICEMLPEKVCWSNPLGKIASFSGQAADPQVCCALCAERQGCRTWNHGDFDNASGTFSCDLYRDIGPNKTSNDGCSGGYSVPSPAPAPRGDKPNIVFLVVESTDGRTWQRGYSDDAIPMPAIRELQEGGVAFHRHYANAPVCCPSRATFWSGRHANRIPHHSAIPGGPMVQGAWNNYEGLPQNFSQRIDQVLASNGYNTMITGKEDWTAGGHSENVYLNSWTMYTRFPYDVNKSGGWTDETDDCGSNGTVHPGGGPRGEGSAHGGDWQALKTGTAFIAKAAQDPTTPFFIYQGMNIVHPPYATNEYWYNKIDPEKITVPSWLPLEDMHPCDFQSSMLKKCTPSDEHAPAFYSEERRRNIRRIYAAEVAEFSDMVGAYMDAVKQANVWNQTVFIVTSDHGDMQMEHQQHYKMVPRDPSSSVPMVIFDGRPNQTLPYPKVVTDPTQLIDIYPTIMDYAQVPKNNWPTELDGFSLLPMMSLDPAVINTSRHTPFVTSQFHGCNIAMSWFLIVQNVNNHTYAICTNSRVWRFSTVTQQYPSFYFLSDVVVHSEGISSSIGGRARKFRHSCLTLLMIPVRGTFCCPACCMLQCGLYIVIFLPACGTHAFLESGEFVNLLNTSTPSSIESIRATLDANLKATIDYPSVAQNVR